MVSNRRPFGPCRYLGEKTLADMDILHARIVEVEIDGKKIRGILYYKP